MTENIEWKILWCLFDEVIKYEVIAKVSEKYFTQSITQEIFTYCQENIIENNIINKDSILVKFNNSTEIKENLIPVDTTIYKTYIDKFVEEYCHNRIHSFGEKILAERVNSDNIYTEIGSLVKDISRDDDFQTIYMSDVVDKIVKSVTEGEEYFDGIATYIQSLDEKLNGLKPGNYIIIAGRPSMGKTALASHIALKNALKGIPTLFFSLEMNHSQLLMRMFASELKIELYKLKRRLLNDAEKIQIKNAQQTFKEMPLIIDESMCDVHQMMAKIQKAKMKYPNLGLILIDYLQLMRGKGGNETEITSNISRGLKSIAKEFNIPIIILSQLNRLCEQRENKRPQLSDLRSSGALEQDADIILFVYRDHYYNYNPKHESLCEINVAKFRDGEVGKILVEYNLKKQYWKYIDHTSKLWEIAKKFLKIE